MKWNGIEKEGGFGRKNGRDLRRCGGRIGELGGIEQNSYRKEGREEMKDEKDIHREDSCLVSKTGSATSTQAAEWVSLTEAPCLSVCLSVCLCMCVCVQKSV